MTITRGGFSKLLAPGYRKVLFESYMQHPLEGQQLVNTNTSKRAYEEDFPIAGFGTLQTKVEGGPFVYQDPIPGAVKRYTWTTYALGYRITEEMMEDDLYGIMGNKLSKALGRSARNNKEIIMFSPYNNAFNTAYSGFVTGEALVGDHVGIRGGTQRNRPAVDTDFGLLAFQAAIENFHALQDESGLPMLMKPKYLVYGPQDEWIVQQILKSPYMPGGNANDINPASRYGIIPVMVHYLTDPDSWFLLAEDHDINYFERRPLRFSNSDDFETGDAKFKASRRAGAGWGDWRGVYGSSGA